MRIVKYLLPALLLVSLFSSQTFAVTTDRISGAIAAGSSVALPGNIHHKALPKFDQGRVDPGLHMGTMTMFTMPTAGQQKALKELVAQQQDRKSPKYRKWLTPEQWADRFGLSQNDARRIAAWLKSQGFSGVNTAHGRNWFSFTGTAAQVESAFGTEIHRFSVGGEMHYANVTAPRIPAELAGIATGFRGLDDFRPEPMTTRQKPGVGTRLRGNYYSGGLQTDFLAPGDIETIYDLKPLYDAGVTGTGQKLVIAGQTDIYLDDLVDFRSGFGLPAINSTCATDSTGLITGCTGTASSNFVYVLDGTDPGVGADITEADLDLEWSAATAPGAQIIFVNSTDVFTSFYYAIDNNLAPVISLSYGACEFDDNGLPADEIELIKANSLGITFMNSSGDAGAAGCDGSQDSGTNNLAVGGLAVSYPASSPEVTGVGGTAIVYPTGFTSSFWGTTNATNGGTAQNPPLPETAWNDDEELTLLESGTTAQGWQENYAIVATGGGVSNCAQQTSDFSNCVAGFGRPSWQNVTISGQATARFSPDVSLLGSPNFPGYIFCTPVDAWVSSSSALSSCNPGGTGGITNALALTDPGNNNSAAPTVVGGTSASAPVFAAMVVLLNQSLGTNGLGNINPTLYTLAATPSNGAFHQVTTGNNNVYCEVGTPVAPWPTALQCPSAGVFGFSASNADATTGYNLVTGLGSVDADKLATAWAGGGATPTPFSLTPTLANFQVTQGAGASATVNVAFADGFTGTVTFTCTLPTSMAQASCQTPSPVNASGQVSFNVGTALPSSALNRPADRGGRIFYAVLLPGLLGIVFTVGTRKLSARSLRLLGLIVTLGFSTLWLASCGGSNSSSNGNQGTPKGTYSISVTGTSGSSATSTMFQITVQ